MCVCAGKTQWKQDTITINPNSFPSSSSSSVTILLTWALRQATLSCSSLIRSVSVTEAVRSSSVVISWFCKSVKLNHSQLSWFSVTRIYIEMYRNVQK